MELLKEPPFSFAVGLVSGVVLGYSAWRWFDPLSSKPASAPSVPSEGSVLSDLLLNTTVEYLLGPNRTVVVIEYRDTIDHVLMVMEESNIVSVPVVDLEKRRYVGMLNVLDIVGFLSANYTTNWNEELANVSVAEVLKTNREPFLPLYATSPVALLLHVMTSLANEVPIMGAEVTRHDVLSFIKENIDSLGPRVDASVHSNMHLTSPVESIESDAKVADALKLMIKKGVSELAVISAASSSEDDKREGGVLVGSLCASDFRRLSVFNFSRLRNEPVSKFISHDASTLVSVDSSASLRAVIQKFVTTKAPVIPLVGQYGKLLSKQDILALSVLNSNFHKLLTPIKETTFFYRIPEGQTTKTLSPKKVTVISPSSIPPSAVQVKVYKKHHTFTTTLHSFPPSVTSIHFGSSFNLPVDFLPHSITDLTFSGIFNQPLDNLPPSLKYIALDGDFDQPLDHLPSSLTHLMSTCAISHPLDHLPASLDTLNLVDFDQPIDHLPPALTHIGLSNFDQPIDYLPSSLTALALVCMDFNFPIDYLPPSLTNFVIVSNQFDQPLDYLPQSLTELSIDENYVFNQPLDHLPSSLTAISISGLFDQSLDHLPSSLKTLGLSKCMFNLPLDHLPSSLTSLQLGDSFDQPIDNLPESLTVLLLGERFSYPLDHLPPSLTHLTLRSFYCKHSIDHLPPLVKRLELLGDFNSPVDNLPPSLTSLKFNFYSEFNYSLDHLPSSLLHLELLPARFSLRNHLPALSILRFVALTPENSKFLPPSLTTVVTHPKMFRHISEVLNAARNRDTNRGKELFPLMLKKDDMVMLYEGMCNKTHIVHWSRK